MEFDKEMEEAAKIIQKKYKQKQINKQNNAKKQQPKKLDKPQGFFFLRKILFL